MLSCPTALDDRCFNGPGQFPVTLVVSGGKLSAHHWTFPATKCVPWSEETTLSGPNSCKTFCAQARVGVYSCQDPFVAPQGHSHQSPLPAVLGAFPPGDQPHSHLCAALGLSCWQTGQFLLASGASERAKGVCVVSARPCIAAHPRVRDPGSYLKRARGNSCLAIPISHLLNPGGLLLMGIHEMRFNTPLTLPACCAPHRIPRISQISTAFLRDHMARPRATAHEPASK